MILPRSAWTGTPNARVGRRLDPHLVTALTIHYPADGPVDHSTLSESQVAQRLRSYRDHHVTARGWLDIGYNYAIDGAGRVWELTGDHVGAHAGAAGNPTSIGVLFILGDAEAPSPAMLEGFRRFRAAKIGLFPRATVVQGHRQVPGTSTVCPGTMLMSLIQSGMLTSPAPQHRSMLKRLIRRRRNSAPELAVGSVMTNLLPEGSQHADEFDRS